MNKVTAVIVQMVAPTSVSVGSERTKQQKCTMTRFVRTQTGVKIGVEFTRRICMDFVMVDSSSKKRKKNANITWTMYRVAFMSVTRDVLAERTATVAIWSLNKEFGNIYQ